MPTNPRRFRIVGDHSDLHAGCAAVANALHRALSDVGSVVAEGDDFDVLIVNGEGSMHHDSPNCMSKMREIEFAQELGKATFLVNTVWQQNGNFHDRILRNLDSLWVRGPRSAADLHHRHSIQAKYAIDLSYYAKVEDVAPTVDFGQAPLITDFWNEDFRAFVRPTTGMYRNHIYLDLAKFDWSTLISSLRTASYVITGRHHGMYAACKARVPFIPIAANTHKFEDLLEAGPAAIPICRTRTEVEAAKGWLLRNRSEYDRLFDWMDKQPPWRFPSSGLRMFTPGFSLREDALRVRTAMVRGDGVSAARIADASLARNPDADGIRVLRRKAWLRAGQIPQAALALAQSRLAGDDPAGLALEFERLARRSDRWIAEGQDPEWWKLCVEIDGSANLDDEPALRRRIERILDSADEPAQEDAARSLLIARFAYRQAWHLADAVLDERRRFVAPENLLEYDAVRHTARRRRFFPIHLDVARSFLLARKGDMELRAAIRDYLIVAGKIDRDLLASAEVDAAAGRDKSAALAAAQAVSIIMMLDGIEAGGELVERHPHSIRLADQMLSVAHAAKSDEHRDLAMLFKVSLRAEEALETILGRSDRIALVGNGLPQADDPSGSEIDRHDLVIRFNNFRLWRNEAQLGSRCDLISTVLHTKGSFDQPSITRARNGVVLGHPSMQWRPIDWSETRRVIDLGVEVNLLPDQARLDTQNRLGTSPSSGMLMTSLIHRFRGGLGNVTIAGMPLLQGRRDFRRVDGEQSAGRHEWTSEAQALSSLREPVIRPSP